ncbi:MAG: hypothetical protein R3Y09_06720 [Clostridia bacterium]
MKEKKLYTCEICYEDYNDKEKAIQCEKSHKKAKGISKCSYLSIGHNATGYPNKVVIEFEDGEKIVYSR